MKYIIHIFFVLIIAFIVLTVLKKQDHSEIPSFVLEDKVANDHFTKTNIKVKSIIRPNKGELEKLRTDYEAIWAHLNNLYTKHNATAGIEYYTEGFFKSVVSNNTGDKQLLTREDVEHNLTITEWSSDGLVCIGTDSNVILKYEDHQFYKTYTKATIKFALLFQGEHWCIDALEFLNEKNITK